MSKMTPSYTRGIVISWVSVLEVSADAAVHLKILFLFKEPNFWKEYVPKVSWVIDLSFDCVVWWRHWRWYAENCIDGVVELILKFCFNPPHWATPRGSTAPAWREFIFINATDISDGPFPCLRLYSSVIKCSLCWARHDRTLLFSSLYL